jgi:hypothetical protein
VRVVELSNHPGDMLDDAARRRVAAERRVHSVYEHELVKYRARIQAIRVRRDRARARHRWCRRRAEVLRLIEHGSAFHDKRRRARSR